MRGKNQGKSRRTKRRKATTRAVNSESSQPRLPNALIQTYDLGIPSKVGSELSFTEFADEVEPMMFADAIKSRSLSIAMARLQNYMLAN